MKKELKHSGAGAAFTDLIVETFKLNGELIRVGDILTKDLGLTSSLWQVFSSIQDDPVHMAQIARNMGLTRQSVRRSVNILLKKELIEFIDNPDNRRVPLVIATKKGQALLRRVNEMQMNWSNDTAKGLSVSEIKDAVKIMNKFRERLSTQIDK